MNGKLGFNTREGKSRHACSPTKVYTLAFLRTALPHV